MQLSGAPQWQAASETLAPPSVQHLLLPDVCKMQEKAAPEKQQQAGVRTEGGWERLDTGVLSVGMLLPHGNAADLLCL